MDLGRWQEAPRSRRAATRRTGLQEAGLAEDAGRDGLTNSMRERSGPISSLLLCVHAHVDWFSLESLRFFFLFFSLLP
jgi:hypothetical protein